MGFYDEKWRFENYVVIDRSSNKPEYATMASSAPSEANALVECAAPIGDMPIFGLLQSATGPQQQQATANSAALKSNAAAAQLCVRSRVMSFPPVSYNLTLCKVYKC